VNAPDSDAVCQMCSAGMFRDVKAQTSSTVKPRSPVSKTALAIQARIRLKRLWLSPSGAEDRAYGEPLVWDFVFIIRFHASLWFGRHVHQVVPLKHCAIVVTAAVIVLHVADRFGSATRGEGGNDSAKRQRFPGGCRRRRGRRWSGGLLLGSRRLLAARCIVLLTT